MQTTNLYTKKSDIYHNLKCIKMWCSYKGDYFLKIHSA